MPVMLPCAYSVKMLKVRLECLSTDPNLEAESNNYTISDISDITGLIPETSQLKKVNTNDSKPKQRFELCMLSTRQVSDTVGMLADIYVAIYHPLSPPLSYLPSGCRGFIRLSHALQSTRS